MISRRRFLTGVAIGLAPMGAPAHAQEYKAQQVAKVPRIGYLGLNRPASPTWERPLSKDCVTSVTSRAATS